MALNVVQTIDDAVKIEQVLVSVSDKAGLADIVAPLIAINPKVMIYSTGGTWQALRDILGTEAAKRNLAQVSDYTGQPEMQGGLVKTLDFKIYLGLLCETYNPAHEQDLKRVNAVPIDLVVVNLYPFKKTVALPDATLEKARANIDIGGPCMVRAAAKNFHRVAALTRPADYAGVVAELRQSGGRISLKTRFALSKKAFAHTAEYDTAIAGYLAACDDEAMARCYTLENRMG